MSDSVAPVGSGAEGNTITSARISASKKWCFTYNNPQGSLGSIGSVLYKYGLAIVGEEFGEENNTRHFQGYVEFKHKTRPLERFKSWGAHWEKAEGTREQNLTYCSKENNFVSNFPMPPPPPRDPMEGKALKWWQVFIVDMLKDEPNDRKVIWLWEERGGVGKTQFAKHLHLKHDAAYVSGAAADIKFAIAGMKIRPRIIIFDIPRSKKEEYISYTAMEEVKNGFFFSGKYESTTVCFDPPHLIVFANFSPQTGEMSADRWDVRYIGYETEQENGALVQ